MKTTLRFACLSAALAAFMLPAALAQSAPPTAGPAPTPPIPKPATIPQRQENQQDRIAQGVKSGQLTAGETANLETKEAAINHEVRADRNANGGKLTPAERASQSPTQSHVKPNLPRQAQPCSSAPLKPGKALGGQRLRQ